LKIRKNNLAIFTTPKITVYLIHDMPSGLTNKVILVTGASGGIGSAAALAFNQAGAKVAITSRRKEKLDQLARQMKDPLVVPADLSSPEQSVDTIRQVIEHFGRIDVLVNNAASIIVTTADTVTPADLLQAFSTNLIAPVVATQEAILHMRRQGGGHIINIGSPGFMMGIPFYAPYVCSKAAFSAWTRTIQAEWSGTGIRISEYFPGYVSTDSKPESRIGEVEQDFLMEKKQNFITKKFTHPKTPDDVARDLIHLILKPKLLMYSDLSVRIGTFIANFPKIRLSIASQMAKTARAKRNLMPHS